MKKKLFLPLSLLTTSLFILSFFYFNSKQNNQRTEYEKFLNQKFKKITALEKRTNDKIPKPDRPDLAAVYDYYRTLDPKLKRVPQERLRKAYKQTKSQNKSRENNTVWQNHAASKAGRTRTVMFDPNDSENKKVWAGSVTGGLWFNNDITDENSGWQTVNDFWDNLVISCMTFDPNNSQIFYVGTGESQTAVTTYRESSGRGIGIWKTTDGGATWSLMPSTENFAYVNDIVVRNENGQSVLYVAVVSGTYKGTVHQATPTDGLYRSTNGENWEQVLPNITGENVPYAPSDIELGADNKLYVGTVGNMNGDGGACILHSTEGTKENWTLIDTYKIEIEQDADYNFPGRIKLAAAPSDANRVYAIVGAGSDVHTIGGYKTYIGKYILRSDDKGVTWTKTNMPEDDSKNWAYLSWHAFVTEVAPDNKDILYIGGLNIYKSTNSGTSWQQVSVWHDAESSQYTHADQHAIAFRPNNPNTAVFSSDGGIFLSENLNNSNIEFSKRAKNYNTLQFYTCAIDPTVNSQSKAGGLQDNGTLFYTPDDANNYMLSGGDGSYCFFDSDEQILITSLYDNQYYAFYGNNSYTRIDNYKSGTFTSPADYDSQNNTIYANAATVTGEYNDQILRISNLPANPIGNFLSLNTETTVPFSAIKFVSQYTSGKILYVGSLSGRLFRVENPDATPTATEIGSSNFPEASISCIETDNSGQKIVVTFSNYGVSSVWYSNDAGNSWKEKEANLPDMPIRWAIMHPNNPTQIMLATEIGVWICNNIEDEQIEWKTDIEGMANVRVDMLRVRKSDNTVLAATHGRGLFTGTFKLDNANTEDATSEKINLHIFPNPTTQNFTIKYQSKKSTDLNIAIYDLTGKKVWEENKNNYSGLYQKKPNVNLAKGTYIVRIKSENNVVSEKLIIQ